MTFFCWHFHDIKTFILTDSSGFKLELIPVKWYKILRYFLKLCLCQSFKNIGKHPLNIVNDVAGYNYSRSPCKRPPRKSKKVVVTRAGRLRSRMSSRKRPQGETREGGRFREH